MDAIKPGGCLLLAIAVVAARYDCRPSVPLQLFDASFHSTRKPQTVGLDVIGILLLLLVRPSGPAGLFSWETFT